jgi:NCAIR mutase (PurE)-related protein
MKPEELKALLEGVGEGRHSIDDVVGTLRRLPVEDLGFARLDTHRELRQGLPEAIYAEGKTAAQVVEIGERLLASSSGPVLATRVPDETATALQRALPDSVHHADARLTVLRAAPLQPLDRGMVVVSAGTSDQPVAEEAAVTGAALGLPIKRIRDVGVAGVHRVLAVQGDLLDAGVVVVVAGMEGALASLVGGITPAPVVAVPTSVGYGASFDGLAALLAMLNSCAAGVTVTNIDNGFGAAVFAARTLLPR